MLVVVGARPLRRDAEHRVEGGGIDAGVGKRGDRVRRRPAAPTTAAMRHGSRIAATPPGIGDGAEVPDALVPVEDRRPGPRRPRACRRGRSRGRRTRARAPARCGRAPPCTRRRARGGAAPRRRGGRGRAANLVDRYSGWRSCATTSGVDAVQRGQVVDGLEERLVRGEVLEVADVVAGDDVVADGDRDRALQLAADGQHRARGANGSAQRLRRVPARAAEQLQPCRRWRAPTESSQRMWICRSWVRRPSTIGPRRATASPSSCAIGSSLLLPLVITSGRADAATAAGGAAASTAGTRRGRADPGATASATGEPGAARGTSTIGRRGESSAADRVVVEVARARRRRRGRAPSRRRACRRAPCGGAAPGRRPSSVASTARW